MITVNPEACVVVIFGAGGDLTRRKLVPALYNLYLDKRLPERCAVIGVDRRPLSDDEFRREMREGVDRFSRRGTADAAAWQRFDDALQFMMADFADPGAYRALAAKLET